MGAFSAAVPATGREAPPPPLVRPVRLLPAPPRAPALPTSADPNVTPAAPSPVAADPEMLRRRRAPDDLDADGWGGDLHHLRRRRPLRGDEATEDRAGDDSAGGDTTGERRTKRMRVTHGHLPDGDVERRAPPHRIACASASSPATAGVLAKNPLSRGARAGRCGARRPAVRAGVRKSRLALSPGGITRGEGARRHHPGSARWTRRTLSSEGTPSRRGKP